jgi:hypothetical protein
MEQIKVPRKDRIFTLLVSLWVLLDPILSADHFCRDCRWMIPYFGQGSEAFRGFQTPKFLVTLGALASPRGRFFSGKKRHIRDK